MPYGKNRIRKFNIREGTVLARKYKVLEKLGSGWEGEVFKVMETSMGIERAAKLFYPHRNRKDRALRFYAKKLHRMRASPLIIQYHNRESFLYKGIPVAVLLSEYVEGELLKTFLARQPGGRIGLFEALHLLHTLAAGMENIHSMHEYHGDLHDENIIVSRAGLAFRMKLVDMYNWGAPSADNVHDDVVDLIRIFYNTLGGRERYARQPAEVKAICCGLRKPLIIRKFRSAGRLKRYIEKMVWSVPQ